MAASVFAATTWRAGEALTGSALALYSNQSTGQFPPAGDMSGIQLPAGIGRIPFASGSPVPAYVSWTLPAPMNQGEDQCVGYAWAAWAMSTPHPAGALIDGSELYLAAKKIDGMPAGSVGTYLQVGARVLQQWGILASVRYTHSVDDVRQQILTQGPAVLDTRWYTRMENPDPGTGYAHPVGSSGERFHAYVCYGFYDAGPDAGAFRCRNSQGDSWGLHGDFLLTSANLQVLFDQGGDAALAEKTTR